MSPRILNYGSINVDEFFHVAHICKSGETISSSKHVVRAGGKGANQSMALAKAGAEVYHAGNLGSDARWIKDLMEKDKVNLDFTHIKEEANGRAFIQVSEETSDNCIVLYPGTNGTNTLEEANKTLESFGKGDWIVQQNEINFGGEIMELAVKKGLRVLFNPAPTTKDLVKTFPFNHVSVLIVNEHEAQDLYEQLGEKTQLQVADLADSLMKHFTSLEGIVITLGKEGLAAKFKHGKETRNFRIKGRKVAAKDTTAAGDTFVGFFLAAYVRNQGGDFFKNVELSLIEANYASSISVTREGSMASIPSLEEVKAAMKEDNVA